MYTQTLLIAITLNTLLFVSLLLTLAFYNFDMLNSPIIQINYPIRCTGNVVTQLNISTNSLEFLLSMHTNSKWKSPERFAGFHKLKQMENS